MRRNILSLIGLAAIVSTSVAAQSSSTKTTTKAKTTASKTTSKTASKTKSKTSTKTATKTTAKKSTATKATSSAAVRVQAPWRLAYNDSKLIVSVDTSQSEKLPDGTYRTRMRWLYTTDQKIEGNKTYRLMMEHRLLDCKKVRSKPIEATVYDASGNRVSSFSTPDNELPYLLWGKRTTGTVNDKALIKTCNLLATKK